MENLKFFLDSANLKEIEKVRDLGFLDGITTNPSLLYKENLWDLETAVKKFYERVLGPINLEVNPNLEKREDITKDAYRLWEYGIKAKENNTQENKIVVKVHMSKEGLAAVKELSKVAIPTNVTLVFSANQALLAAKAGAGYVSPFVGRLDDIGQNGMDLVKEIKQIYNNYGYKTQIIVGSVRSPLHVLEAAKAGADIATIPYKTFEQLFEHPLTDAGIERFRKDYNSLMKCEKA